MVPNTHAKKYKGSFDQNSAFCTKGINIKEYKKLPDSIGYSYKFSKAAVLAGKGEFNTIKSESPGLYLC